MTIEERLKKMIISQYGTMKDFTSHIGIPNSTFANIMRRGIGNANVLNVMKICQALNISTSALAEGMILPLSETHVQCTALEDILDQAKQQMLTGHVTLNGKLLTDDQIETITSALDLIVELEKRKQ